MRFCVVFGKNTPLPKIVWLLSPPLPQLQLVSYAPDLFQTIKSIIPNY